MKDNTPNRPISHAHAQKEARGPRPAPRRSARGGAGTRPRADWRSGGAPDGHWAGHANPVWKARTERTLRAILASATCSFGEGVLIGSKMQTSAGDLVLFARVDRDLAADGVPPMSVMSVPALEAAIEGGIVELLQSYPRP